MKRSAGGAASGERDMRGRGTVVLVHGYFKGARNMRPLGDFLAGFGYRVTAVDVPATFGSLAECRDALARKLDSLETGGEPIHLVGHSFGGLVIRALLAKKTVPPLGRCVLIGTPNRGSRLADLGRRFFHPSFLVLKPLSSLVTDAPPISPPVNVPPPEFGIIAGNRNRLLTGIFLSPESDGRVEVESTKLDGMADFIVLPSIHTKIHKQRETAELVDRFLRTGRFGG
jgi:pimeloyl-ACP methyl ester carboxylesterase